MQPCGKPDYMGSWMLKVTSRELESWKDHLRVAAHSKAHHGRRQSYIG